MKLALMAVMLAAPAWAGVPQVMTDIPPVQALAAQVMGDLGTPGMLLDKGGDEHDLALRPSQMRALAAADLVIWVGPELTPGLAAALNGAGLALLDDPATRRRDYPGGGVNPHAWLDPGNAAAWAGLIAARLADLDPDHAGTYRANAAAAVARITALDGELAAALAPLADRPFLGWHDAYAYLAAHYHLAYQGGLSEGDEAPPGAARLADLADEVRQGRIACLFPEAGQDAGLARALGPVTLGAPLDPAGATLDPGPGAYDQLMRNLAAGLAACLRP